MVCSPTMGYAADLNDSGTSTYTDGIEGYDTVGKDMTQGKISSKTGIYDVTDTTYTDNSEAEVYATRKSKFSVIIPKVITLDGKVNQGSYQVAVKGDISGNQEIAVTAPNQFTMTEQNASVDKKADIIANIHRSDDGGAKVLWDQSEIKQDTFDGTGTTVGKISAPDITAGSWYGKFDFNIQCLDNCVEEALLSLSTNFVVMNTTSEVRVNAYSNGSISNEDVTWTSDNDNIIVKDGVITATGGAKDGEAAVITATLKKNAVSTFALSRRNTEELSETVRVRIKKIDLSDRYNVEPGESKVISVSTDIINVSCSNPKIKVTKTEDGIKADIPANVKVGSQYQVTLESKDTTEVYTLYVDTPDKHQHYYTYEVKQEPTCGVDGYKIGTCYCGDRINVSIPATGEHTSKSSEITKVPTCTETGIRTHICADCGLAYTTVEAKDPENHDYVGTVKKAATYTEKGITTYTCSRCGDSYDLADIAILVDNEQPTGTLSIDGVENYSGTQSVSPKTYWNTDTCKVSIRAEDAKSGVDKVEYYDATAAVSDPSTIISWSEYKDAFNINMNRNHVLYAKITDRQGNVKYLNSTGTTNVKTYTYIGNIQSDTLPKGDYTMECYGGAGGNIGIKGGYSKGNIKLSNSQTLYIVCGGRGGNAGVPTGGAGGYNGGGKGGNAGKWEGSLLTGGGGGGGATHIATSTGLLSSLSSNRSSVLLVAGGAGGSCSYWGGGIYGTGGGTAGGTSTLNSNAAGGTQTSGYAFGQGQNCTTTKTDQAGGGVEGNGGGGGGWYGGYANLGYGGSSNAHGGGGSGYVNTSKLANTSMSNGVNSGNGYVVITKN